MVKVNLLKNIALSVLLLIPGVAFSQELYCNVQISSQKIQGSNREVFDNMQKDIYEFMNNTVWTNHVFTYAERVECSILINLTDQLSADEFSGTITIQLKRPVYNTTYNSTVLNFIDNSFRFSYVEFQPLEFDPTTYRSSLVSVLAYYTYMILGFDADTFSPEGGTEYFQKALKICNNAQGSNDKGWRAYEAKKQDNRYYLIENLTNSKYGAVRRASYRYHRTGLDVMSDKLEAGKSEIEEALKYLQKVYRSNPNLFIIKIFFDAKHTELVNIYSGSFAADKTRIQTMLKEIDPARISDYEKLTSTGNN